MTTPKKIGGYDLGDKIGSGATARVYRGSNASKSKPTAIKIYTSSADITYFLNELSVYNRLGKHVNIVEYMSSFVDLRVSNESEAFPVIVTKYYSTTLNKLLKKTVKTTSTGFNFTIAKTYALELAQAVQHLHYHDIIHTDIKLNNIYLDNNHIKLGDFGSSGINNVPFSLEVGTIPNIPIELLYSQPYTNKADIWEYMCCFYELLTGSRLFDIDTVIDGEDDSIDTVVDDNDDSSDNSNNGKTTSETDSSSNMSSGDYDYIPYDTESDTYKTLSVMQDYLGCVPKKYYVAKYHQEQPDLSIHLKDKLFEKKLIRDQLERYNVHNPTLIEKFLLTGFKYESEQRTSIGKLISTLKKIT